MKAAFLIRCSTKNQDLSRQTRDLTRLATSMGFEYDLDNLVYGEKITGKDDVTKKNRDSIDRLLKAAKEQKFDVVLVSEVSRMSRDPASGRVYVRLLINMGIPVYFKDIDTWTIDPDTGKKVKDAELVIGAGFDAAWKYLRSMKTQIASARRNQLDNGAISVGQPFFGYKYFGGRDKTTKTRWVVNEDEAEVVEATFNEYIKEGATLKSTALAITEKYGEKLNKRFTVGTIEHILSYDSYHTGIKKINLTDPDSERIEVFEVEVPKLVSAEMYEQAKAKRSKNRVLSEYPAQTTRMLSKMLKCPCCGYTMTPRNKMAEGRERAANGAYRMINGIRAMSWCCMSGVNKATDCDNRMSVANEKLEPIVWELIKKELINYANLNNEDREAKVREIEENITNRRNSIELYLKEIDRLKKKVATAYQFSLTAVEAAGDDEELKAVAMDNYNTTVKTVRKEQNNYQNSIEQAKTDIENLELQKTFYSQPNVTADLVEKAENDEAEKRNLVKELITKIVPYQIKTLQVKERYGEGYKTLKLGVVLLEVYTVTGIFYVLYNTNERGSTRYAYYMNGIYANFQNGINKFPAYEEGEYFVISNANMVIETEDIDAVVSVNDFKQIAEMNNWVLSYPYVSGN